MYIHVFFGAAERGVGGGHQEQPMALVPVLGINRRDSPLKYVYSMLQVVSSQGFGEKDRRRSFYAIPYIVGVRPLPRETRPYVRALEHFGVWGTVVDLQLRYI